MMIPYSFNKADDQPSLVMHADLSTEVRILISILVTVF